MSKPFDLDQGRRPALAVQIRSSPSSPQNSPFPPSLGPTPRPHPTSRLDAARDLRMYQDLRIQLEAHGGAGLSRRHLVGESQG